MIDKIERLLRRWSKSTPKATYFKYLEQFEKADTSITTLPIMLVEFWRRVDLKHFETGPTLKEMMYEKVHVRHKSISELAAILAMATGSLAQDDENFIHEISINQFAVFEDLTMDDYFANSKGGSVSYSEGVAILRQAMLAHGDVIENMPPGYHCRMLNRMYNDILNVTVTIVNQMKDS
ncbi:hypothetical protein ST201phi2-1p256 [Pseudomonas phage 201phi2-1]|uniref:Uncharacterized protein n=1 Tax=Pseudomonas phage 201phi2-1 TaxID=198110 RepID=B3FJB8_BP201|nr:hypothetical protein ST201phi2-1p256 [Pseudomonas phage 201phi2-1]ABY63084.1 hypothetical protein 201phi2-1p256 [Pseudomonas phage 201phi2-1]